jgi:hypothetical protein
VKARENRDPAQNGLNCCADKRDHRKNDYGWSLSDAGASAGSDVNEHRHEYGNRDYY